MIINRVLRRANEVTLCGADGSSLRLTYEAWADFIHARSRITIPFDVTVERSNVTRLDGEEGVIIRDASNLS